MFNNFKFMAGMAVALALGGCAGIHQFTKVGESRAEVIQSLGKPTATYPLGQGTRLQYSMQPLGRQVYDIDLDAQGKVTQVTQMLDPTQIEKLLRTPLNRDQLRLALGEPALVGAVARFDGPVWTYRYDDLGERRLLHFYIDLQGQVVRAYTTEEVVRHIFPD